MSQSTNLKTAGIMWSYTPLPVSTISTKWRKELTRNPITAAISFDSLFPGPKQTIHLHQVFALELSDKKGGSGHESYRGHLRLQLKISTLVQLHAALR